MGIDDRYWDLTSFEVQHDLVQEAIRNCARVLSRYRSGPDDVSNVKPDLEHVLEWSTHGEVLSTDHEGGRDELIQLREELGSYIPAIFLAILDMGITEVLQGQGGPNPELTLVRLDKVLTDLRNDTHPLVPHETLALLAATKRHVAELLTNYTKAGMTDRAPLEGMQAILRDGNALERLSKVPMTGLLPSHPGD